MHDMNSMRTHLQSSRHRVTMLAQQLRASGSMHANQQGICVSEAPEGLVTQVSTFIFQLWDHHILISIPRLCFVSALSIWTGS
jgi:hypothetical protein